MHKPDTATNTDEAPVNNTADTERLPDPRVNMLKTYARLRWALFVAGVGLPLVLLVGGAIMKMPVQDSMSQYYHAGTRFRPTEEQRTTLADAAKIEHALARTHRTPGPTEQETLEKAHALDKGLFSTPGSGEMRDWFVGGLFIVGILLIAYKGYLPDESVALNLAGLFAMGVAVFYMPWGGQYRSWIDDRLEPLFDKLPWQQHVPSIHYVCALMLFFCLGYVCFFCGAATLELPGDPGPDGKGRSLSPREKTMLRWAYRGCGAIMVISPVAGAFVSHIPGTGFEHARVFIIEAVGVIGFAAYWGLKSWEISKTGADRLVAKHQVEMVPSKKLLEGHRLRIRALPSE